MNPLCRYAAAYHKRGWNPIPARSHHGRMHPPFPYAQARDEGLPLATFRRLAEGFDCDGLQVALGRRWGLVVLDLDGAAGVAQWASWRLQRPVPRTWVVRHDHQGGAHLWFRVDREGPAVPHHSVLWKGPGEHEGIELLGDGNLIVAPPSTSPRSGNRYEFLPGRSPHEIDQPAPLPGWLLALIPREAPPVPSPWQAARQAPRPQPLAGRWQREQVVAAIADPVELLRNWGVRVVDASPNLSGWYRTRSLFREDRHPSASVSRNGVYWEPGLTRCLSLFDVAVSLGLYPDVPSAIDGVGHGLGLAPQSKPGGRR